MSELNDKDLSILNEINSKTYEEQAIWFCNSEWLRIEKDLEQIWSYHTTIVGIDDKGVEGNKLNEFDTHRFIESLNEPLSVVDMRKTVMYKNKKDTKDKSVSFLEFLSFRFKSDLKKVIHSPQIESSDELEKAKELLKEAEIKLNISLKKSEECKQMEAKQKAAENDVKRALSELERQEKEYNDKVESLKKKSEESKSIVLKNKAKNELSQLLAEDPLPLRKAKIDQGAAVRKAENITAKVVEARKAADLAVKEANKKFEEAKDYLDEISKTCGSNGNGTKWWMEKKLEEMTKFMPQSKGGKQRK